MFFKKWDELPEWLKTDAVRPYYEHLRKKRFSIALIKICDFLLAALLLLALSPLLLAVACVIKCAEPHDKILFLQKRVTQYGREFLICKFRTMKTAKKGTNGTELTVQNDHRVTKAGVFLRKFRLDELPQLFNILKGDMAFIGARPEVPRYTASYSAEMCATLLLPAGVSSTASIAFKDEALLLQSAGDAEETYTKKILPAKMRYNLEDIMGYGVLHNIKIIAKTIAAVLEKPS